MKETNEKKFAYIAAVDTREIKIDRELKENQRCRDDYVADVLMLIDTARSMMARIYNRNTARNPQGGPRNDPTGMPPDVNFDTGFGFDGQGSFDGAPRSIPSRPDGTSMSTPRPLRQGSVVGAAGLVTLREDDEVSAITSVTIPRVKDKKKKRRWFRWRR